MKKIIITAGGTREKIDNVRRITNSSSGKLGMIIANQLLTERKDIFIYYICSKNSLRPDDDRIKIIEIDGTIDLKNNIENLLKNDQIDYFIHSMAVSDYMTDYVTTVDKIKKSILEHNDVDEAFKNIDVVGGNKISSHENNLVIVLKQTPKIISIIKDISPSTYLVGFKLLDEVSKNELIEEAKRLRNKNNCDLVVANDLSNIRKGEHKGYIIDINNNIEEAFGKDDIAKILIKKMFNDKRKLFNNLESLCVVGVSQWITNEANKSILRNAKKLTTIYNWIDLDIFRPKIANSQYLYDKYHISSGLFTVLFVSSIWKNDEKWNDFLKISAALNKEFQVVCVGRLNNDLIIPECVIHMMIA